MIISDLNYFEDVNEATGIIGGGGVKFDSKIQKKVNIDKKVRIDVNKNVKSKVDVKGNLAEAESISDAIGKDSLAETFTQTQTDDYFAGSYSDALAATP